MNHQAHSERCDVVREALLTDSYERVTREEANTHLEQHDVCAEWAARALLIRHALATTSREQGVPLVDDEIIEAFVEGTLSTADRRRVEDACCDNIELAGKLEKLKTRRLEAQFGKLPPSAAAGLLEMVEIADMAPLIVRLEEFRGLYRDKPLAVAAAHEQRSVFQTPDGRFVVSVVDRGADCGDGPHAVELGIRVHEPKWIGGWAAYRIIDTLGNMAATGLVKVAEHGASARVSVPPTDHGPYTVYVQMVDVETSRLAAMLAAAISEPKQEDLQ